MQPSPFSGLAVSFLSGELVLKGLILSLFGHAMVTTFIG